MRPAATGRQKISLEERIGARWAVWLGGFALALGGIFLVQYSIEQGWLGPAVRVFLGALLAAALLAGAEWMRRHEKRDAIAGVATAHIPSILTAAGTTVAFATVYAAYALYGFIGAPLAFALLGAIGLATLAAALVHGPWLAGLGLIGSYVAPALVATAEPDYWALALYVTLVTATSFALANARAWRWLALAGVAFGVFWILPGLGEPAALSPSLAQMAAGFALAAVFIVPGFVFDRAKRGFVDLEASAPLVAYLLGTALVVLSHDHDTLALATLVVLAVATVGIALRTEAATLAVPAAASDRDARRRQLGRRWGDRLAAPGGPRPGRRRLRLRPSAWRAQPLRSSSGSSGYAVQRQLKGRLEAIIWAATAVATPIALLITCYRGDRRLRALAALCGDRSCPRRVIRSGDRAAEPERSCGRLRHGDRALRRRVGRRLSRWR